MDDCGGSSPEPHEPVIWNSPEGEEPNDHQDPMTPVIVDEEMAAIALIMRAGSRVRGGVTNDDRLAYVLVAGDDRRALDNRAKTILRRFVDVR